jgi:hypothetical protein
MKFTVRMFAATRHGHEFIHRDVELPDGLWMKLQAWASTNRGTLIRAKYADRPERVNLMAPLYASYGELSRSIPLELAQDAGIQAAIAHFFNLAIDNPEMLPTELLGGRGELLRSGQESEQAVGV